MVPVVSTEHFVNINLEVPNPGGPDLSVVGQIWYDDALRSERGVSFYFGPRVIIQAGDPASRHSFSKRGAQAYSGRGVTGFLQLIGWKKYLNLKKDGISNKGLRDKMNAMIYDAIEEDILKLSQQGKRKRFLSNVMLNGVLALDLATKFIEVAVVPTKRGPIVNHPGSHPRGAGKPRTRKPKVAKVPAGGTVFTVELDHIRSKGLSSTDIEEDSITVWLSIDHEWVSTAIDAEDQGAVNQLLASSIATEFIMGGGTDHFEASFSKSVLEWCDGLKPTQQVSYLQGILFNALQANKVS